MSQEAFGWVLAWSVVSIALIVPALVVFVECLVAFFDQPEEGQKETPTPSTVVLIPAHNEEAGITATIASLKKGMEANQRIVVVADNCDDDTAAVARNAGTEVIERFHDADFGKGFALSFGIDHLRLEPPEVVVIIDADCVVSDGAVKLLAQKAAQTESPVQAEYIFHSTSNRGIGVVSALATLVRNRARPRGLANLGLPCHLVGTGMAFPWEVLLQCPPMGAHLVEDLMMGIELAYEGHLTTFFPRVAVHSELPQSDDAAIGQRRRWEHGQLKTMLDHGPRLLWRGLSKGRPGLVALALDLLVPPLALYSLLLGLLLVFNYWIGVCFHGWQPFTISIFGTLALLSAIVASWWRFGRGEIPGVALLQAPLYVLTKIPMYVAFLVGRGQRLWQRTRRAGEEEVPQNEPDWDE